MLQPRVTWRKARAAIALPGRERGLLIRAAAWLLLVDLGLRTLGFARLRRLLGRLETGPRTGAPAGDAARGEAEDLAHWVAVAGRHHLYPMRCLSRALALGALLARRGIPARVRIGVRKKGDAVSAHAWVEHGGRPLAESGDVDRRYAPFAVSEPGL